MDFIELRLGRYNCIYFPSHSVNNDAGNPLKKETNESLIEIAGKLLGDFLNPTYVSQDEDELWKKKRKLRR